MKTIKSKIVNGVFIFLQSDGKRYRVNYLSFNYELNKFERHAVYGSPYFGDCLFQFNNHVI